MKKRAAAVLLSLTLCASTVVQTGAASMESVITDAADELSDSIGESEEAAQEIPAAQEVAETDSIAETSAEYTDAAEQVPQAETVAEASDEDLLSDSSEDLSSGEEVTQVQESVPTPLTVQTEAVVSVGNTAVVDDTGAIVVSAADWVKVSQGWRLVKHKVSSAGQAEAGEEAIPEENPVQEILVEDDSLSGEAGAIVQETEAGESFAGQEPEAVPAETAQEVPAASVDEAQAAETAQPAVPEEVSVNEQETLENAEEPAADVNAAGTGETAYYTAADGIIKINTVTIKGSHTGFYLFDENGIMVTGKKTVSPGTPGYEFSTKEELYFTEDSTAALYSEYSNVAKDPITSDLGQQKKNYWLYQNGKFRLYGASGKNVSVSSLNEKYKSQGYLKINGEYYCLKNDGTPRTGEVKINGSMYYFEPDSKIPGRMFREGWKKFVNAKGEKWVYYNRENKGKDRGKAVKYNGNVAITITPLSTTTKYLLDHNGYILKSKRALTVDGACYGSDAQGRIYKNKIVKYGNYRYYFTANGKQVGWKNMWKQCPAADNRFYYFGSTPGRISEKTGWQRVTWPSGKFLGWFYFASNGEHYRNTLTSDYYFDKYGKLASGVTTVNGKTYFFEISSSSTRRGKMFKNTLITYNGNWYYAEADGQLANNTWKQIDGSWYRFENYVTQKNTFRWKGDTYGYLDAQGKFCTGWIIYSNTQNLVRYVNPNGGGFYTNTSAVIDGLRYYFDSNGYRINDLTSVIRGPYYVKVDRVNGLMTIYDSTGTIPVKSVRVSVGAAGTPTPLGTYTLRSSLRWQPLMGPSYGQYGVHVVGAGRGGIFIHSVPGAQPNLYSVPAAEYNKLGNPASHGCIRVCVADCKWVYQNCNGAKITIYDGAYKADEAMKGPLGRRALEPMRYPYNFDPTDPAI